MKSRSIFRTEIMIDEEKVIKEGVYKLNEIYTALDTLFAKYKLPRVEAEGNARIYQNGTSEKDFANMWNINLLLREQAWFVYNVIKWVWYLNENPDDPDDCTTEDLIRHYILPYVKDGVWKFQQKYLNKS